MSIRSLCRDSVTHQPRTATVGTAGSNAFSRSGTTKKRCMVQPRSSLDAVILQQREYVVTHVLYFPTDPESSHGDEFVVVEPAGLKGKRLQQVGEPVNQAGRGRLWRVDCEEKGRDQ